MGNVTLLYIYSDTDISKYTTNDISQLSKEDMDKILLNNEGELISVNDLIYLFNNQYISDEGYLLRYIN
jgi:hypothetical protein